MVDETYGDEELGSFNLSASGPHTAQIMAKLSRNGSAWTMTAIGSPAGGRRYDDLFTVVAQHLDVTDVRRDVVTSQEGEVEHDPADRRRGTVVFAVVMLVLSVLIVAMWVQGWLS
ncbi:hypothetical protein K1W54_11060 [Micromonospora sp. CPCC 205371]|nr:hypothetical protein [Micromonospora sp. CPCC 205371]